LFGIQLLKSLPKKGKKIYKKKDKKTAKYGKISRKEKIIYFSKQNCLMQSDFFKFNGLVRPNSI
jgi:hypothetical protein